MKEAKFKSKILNATKWSTITELLARLVMPITNIVLARLLTPEAFGVVATIIMIMSFAEIFTDAGFQKYIIQREFKNEKDLYKNATVAYWTNLIISLFLWGGISVFSESLAVIVGNPGLGIVIIVAGMSLPLIACSSIQMAIYRRNFDYKTLFFVRTVGIFIPFVITIPLALGGFSYWALVIGTICGNLANAIILNWKSSWRPNWFYSISLLKEMISFSMWSLVEAISIWLTSWSGTFIVATVLSTYYLGIYKTSMTTVNGIMGIITGATTSILFSSLSRLQNNEAEYNKTFFTFQRIVGVFVLPMGVGIYMYSDLITTILLGSQWEEASLFIGLWGLTSSISIIFAHYSSEVYRSKGKPKLSFFAQILHLVVMIPVLIISANYTFTTLVYARSLVRFQFIIVHFILMYFVIKISPWKMIKNVFPSIICASLMGVLAYFLQQLKTGMLWDFISIGICVVFYFSINMVFPSNRNVFSRLIKKKLKVKK